MKQIDLFGHKVNSWYLIGGGAAVVGGYIYWKRQANASAAAASSSSTTSASSIDPLTGLPVSEDNTIDPETGMTYLAEAQQYGSVSAAEAQVSEGDLLGSGGGLFGGTSGFPTQGITGTTTPVTGGFATDAQWSQAVQQDLVGIGYSSQAVGAALGLFFTGHPLTSDQAQIIQVAEAELGPPPVGNYPIISSPTPPPTTQGFQAFAPGGKSLAQLAPLYKFVTAADLEKMNPGVFKQYGSKPLPKGTGYYVPKEAIPTS
jgi:hypothetical protein